jgi:hypothetical protein
LQSSNWGLNPTENLSFGAAKEALAKFSVAGRICVGEGLNSQ